MPNENLLRNCMALTYVSQYDFLEFAQNTLNISVTAYM